MKYEIRNRNRASGILSFLFIILPACSTFLFSPVTTFAATPDSENINSDKFMIVACDGPTIPKEQPQLLAARNTETQKLYGRNYIPCDFNGMMRQVQHVINIAIVVGVLAAIFGFIYAGALYITGVEKNISKAREIFPKVGIGFIIMLSAWFIVFQILTWLTGEGSGFTTLLGK